jgi:hypothetical protein
MNPHEGTQAIQNARQAIIILAWIFLIVGVALTIMGLTYDYDVNWGMLYPGIILIIAGVSNCILNAVLKGFERIVEASEKYLNKMETL